MVKWEEISNEEGFIRVEQNSENEAIWAMMKKNHHSGVGYAIALYDPQKNTWLEDSSQPNGAYNIAVDSKGMPAFS